MDVFFARIVMPRSLSRSLLSMIRSVPDIASFARNVPDCFRRQSTSVVLPWSTCAMIAMLRSPDMWPASLLLPEAAREERHELLPRRREVHREGQLAVRLPREKHPHLRPGLGVQELA